jgi:hypothetical protein
MKNIFYSVLMLFIAIPVYAGNGDKENFDRLFTSQSERQKLDNLRKQGLLYKKPVSDAIDENKPVAKRHELKVSGIVLRADGKAQVWVSGEPLYSSLKKLNATKNTSADLRIPLEGKSISLKPGQVLENGKAREAYYFVTHSSVSSQALAEPQPQPQPQSVMSSSIASVSSVASSSVSSQGGNHAQTKSP